MPYLICAWGNSNIVNVIIDITCDC
jgi:hypothetical protein